MQFELPVEEITYHIKPLELRGFPYRMRFRAFNCEVAPPSPEGRGYYRITASDVPALHKEPEMPPENQVKHWGLVYYEEDRRLSEEDFWKLKSRELYNSYKQKVKVNGDVERIAAAATAGATTPEAKLEKLVAYCRKNIKNISGEEATTEERESSKRNNSTIDTLVRGQGTAYDINLAFAALAIAAGFDARLARLADRGDTFFDKRLETGTFSTLRT